jgi:hypothetical protein
MRFLQFTVFIFALLTSFAGHSQKKFKRDTINKSTDSIYFDQKAEEAELIKMYATRYDPRLAGLYSAAIPGLGQAYNKKYWKIPLIYGAFYGIYYAVNLYENDYQSHRKELLEFLADDTIDPNVDLTPISNLNQEQIRNRVNRSRRERDYYIIIGCVLYMLNIADAHIDAHLKEFDLNEKLKLSVDPSLSRSFNSTNAGLSLTLHFN